MIIGVAIPEKLLRTVAGGASRSSIASPLFPSKSAENTTQDHQTPPPFADRAARIRRRALTEDDVPVPPREQPLVCAPPFLAEEARHEGLAEAKPRHIVSKGNARMKARRRRAAAGPWGNGFIALAFFFLPFLTRNSSTEAGLGMSRGAL